MPFRGTRNMLIDPLILVALVNRLGGAVEISHEELLDIPNSATVCMQESPVRLAHQVWVEGDTRRAAPHRGARVEEVPLPQLPEGVVTMRRDVAELLSRFTGMPVEALTALTPEQAEAALNAAPKALADPDIIEAEVVG